MIEINEAKQYLKKFGLTLEDNYHWGRNYPDERELILKMLDTLNNANLLTLEWDKIDKGNMVGEIAFVYIDAIEYNVSKPVQLDERNWGVGLEQQKQSLMYTFTKYLKVKDELKPIEGKWTLDNQYVI